MKIKHTTYDGVHTIRKKYATMRNKMMPGLTWFAITFYKKEQTEHFLDELKIMNYPSEKMEELYEDGITIRFNELKYIRGEESSTIYESEDRVYYFDCIEIMIEDQKFVSIEIIKREIL